MTSNKPQTGGFALTAYAVAARSIPLLAPPLLRRRLKRGKEDAERWREKLGEPTTKRPDGPLVWLHAVGLGEVLALRGLITSMSAQNPALNFLVTSTARSSAQVMGSNLPPRTIHQFLPLDAPQYLRKFLDHWRPDLSIWSEQDLWPNAISQTDARAIPVTLVNARITDASLQKRRLGRALYVAMFARMSLIAAQEERTAANLRNLGAQNVRVTGSLKSAAPALGYDTEALAAAKALFAHRTPWLAASTHQGDETVALQAQQALCAQPSAPLLILAPRDITRARQIAQQVSALGLTPQLRSEGIPLSDATQVYIADTYGELGLFYRLCDRALIGGGFDAIGGHNPWEAAALDCAILHGPDTANFEADYRQLHDADAATQTSAATLSTDLSQTDHATKIHNARALSDAARDALTPLAADLCALMPKASA